MNRKQRVAVVVGVVVIVLLVLFLPYGDAEGSCPTLYQWAGSEPPKRLVTYEVDADDAAPGLEDLDVVEVRDVRDRSGRARKTFVWSEQQPYVVSTFTLVVSLYAAMALTVAAVIVLKDRRD